jgi:hypothetical protein
LTGGARCAPFLKEKKQFEDGKTLGQRGKPIPLLGILIPQGLWQGFCGIKNIR